MDPDQTAPRGTDYGCDMRPQLPVMVKIQPKKKGRCSSFLTKYKITRELIKNQRVLFDP